MAAVRARRHFAGYDTDATYVEKALARVAQERTRLALAGPGADTPGRDPVAAAVARGLAAKDVARILLEACGFTRVETGVRLRAGLAVAFRALDGRGQAWLFDLLGGFSSARPGLRRPETLWKAVGKAAAPHELDRVAPVVLLTTDLPPPGSTAASALSAVSGEGKLVRAVIDILDPAHQRRLGELGGGGAASAPGAASRS